MSNSAGLIDNRIFELVFLESLEPQQASVALAARSAVRIGNRSSSS
jgi:hypothetical protein